METIVPYLFSLSTRKQAAIKSILPVTEAFLSMRGTRSGHVLYFCVGKRYSSENYGDRFGYSRRHARRLYLRALGDFYKKLSFYGGKDLIERFSA